MFSYCELPDRGMIRVGGADALEFLQGIVTNDVHHLNDKPGLFAAMLTPQGKFLHDFFLLRFQDAVLIDCEADAVEPILKKLKLYKLRSRIDLQDVSDQWHAYAVWGKQMAQAFLPQGAVALLDPRHGLLGMRIYTVGRTAFAPGPEGEARDFSAYDAHRLQLGVPDGSRDASDRNFLLELGYDQLHGVSFDKGCYVGQEPTARMHYRQLLRKCLFCIRPAEGDRLPVSGVPLTIADKEVGDMRSSAEGLGLAQLRIAEWRQAERDGTPILAGGLALRAVPPDYMQAKLASLPADEPGE